jgi:putative ABC transport system ATP-binding protein
LRGPGGLFSKSPPWPPEAGTQVIQLEQVSVTKDGTDILKSINLEIRKGEKVLLKGESGSGKSTLIKSLLFFEYFRGQVLFEGKPVTKENLGEYRLQSTYIGQTVPNFNEGVRDFLLIPYGFRANRKLEVDGERLRELLAALNFDETVLDKNYAELSGGEKQRMMILQVLMLNKPVFFLDEVTSALDKKNIAAAISLITEDKERTVLSISHNEEWEEYCTRVLVMDKGEIREDILRGGH